jgi:hypothetical protein
VRTICVDFWFSRDWACSPASPGSCSGVTLAERQKSVSVIRENVVGNAGETLRYGSPWTSERGRLKGQELRAIHRSEATFVPLIGCAMQDAFHDLSSAGAPPLPKAEHSSGFVLDCGVDHGPIALLVLLGVAGRSAFQAPPACFILTDRFPESRAVIRCLPFDGTDSRHPSITSVYCPQADR